jgi:lysozyme
MRMSGGGLEFLIREEGSIPHAYNDPSGFATFGVGHLIAKRRVTRADEAVWGSKAHPRPDRVLPTLRNDLRRFEHCVESSVHTRLTQNEFDALVSLAFNIGEGAFASSTVVRRLNNGDRLGAADAIMMWSNSAGRPILRPRRERERALFLKADPARGAAAWLRPDELRWVRELDKLREDSTPSAENIRRRGVLIRVLTARRKAIWREAQKTGWEVNHRRERYGSLLARTR